MAKTMAVPRIVSFASLSMNIRIKAPKIGKKVTRLIIGKPSSFIYRSPCSSCLVYGIYKLSKKLRLDRIVSFEGRKKEVVNYYRKASIFISTSRAEGFPNALLEAMSMGCACVATDCLTGPSEMIENCKNGFLVEVDNVENIKEKLELLLKNESLRNEFSTRAIEKSKKYDIDSIISKWEVYIEKIIG